MVTTADSVSCVTEYVCVLPRWVDAGVPMRAGLVLDGVMPAGGAASRGDGAPAWTHDERVGFCSGVGALSAAAPASAKDANGAFKHLN